MATPRRALSIDLQPQELRALRRLLEEAFAGDFGEADWSSSLGGTHVLVEESGLLVSHASVVPRRLRVGDRELRTGYVEAVATRPDRQRSGHASLVLAEVGAVIGEGFEIGALSTGRPSLYARLGWEMWRGPTFVEAPAGAARTPDEDGGIMVLRTPATGPLDLDAPITCDWRPGDVW